jgi:hypothetical protein
MDELHATLADHPAVELHEAMTDVAAKVDSLVAQPGPGPAMAMIAAGLSERFEAKTDELASSLASLAATVASAREGMQAAAASGSELAATLVERLAAMVSAGFGDAAANDAGVRSALDGLTEQLGRDHLDLAGVRAAVGELGTSVRHSLDEHISSFDRRLDGSDAALHGLAEALGAYQAGVEQLGEAVQGEGGMADAVAAVGAQVSHASDEVRRALEHQTGSNESVGVALASLLDAVDSASSGVASAVGEGFFDAAARQAAILEAVHRLGGLVEADHGDLDALQKTMLSIVTSTERAGTVTGQVAELLLENRAALRDEVQRLDAAVRGQVELIAGRTASTEEMVIGLNDQLAHLDVLVQGFGSRLQAGDDLHDLLGSIGDEVRHLTTMQATRSTSDPAGEVGDVVRREAELLTQRVAALSVTLESIRTLMADHAEETANSIGRKASEVGRKLAGDLGIRPKKPAGRRAAESKQIGPPR